ncbi:MAG TPA: hypothetical protein VHG93_03790, partial [Longimicrobium sp.]|nr:hypothetical protein [Longimicrobium sp.]
LLRNDSSASGLFTRNKIDEERLFLVARGRAAVISKEAPARTWLMQDLGAATEKSTHPRSWLAHVPGSASDAPDRSGARTEPWAGSPARVSRFLSRRHGNPARAEFGAGASFGMTVRRRVCLPATKSTKNLFFSASFA